MNSSGINFLKFRSTIIREGGELVKASIMPLVFLRISTLTPVDFAASFIFDEKNISSSTATTLERLTSAIYFTPFEKVSVY